MRTVTYRVRITGTVTVQQDEGVSVAEIQDALEVDGLYLDQENLAGAASLDSTDLEIEIVDTVDSR